MSEIRLNKAIAQTGFCSRREADKLIEQGRVVVNGKTAGIGVKVGPDDEVKLDGEFIQRGKKGKKKQKSTSIIYHKPIRVVGSNKSDAEENLMDAIGLDIHLQPLGDLDKQSSGVMLLTNDTDLMAFYRQNIRKVEQEFTIVTETPITHELIGKMTEGVPLGRLTTRKAQVEFLNENLFKIVITDPISQQIKRMCHALGIRAKKIIRSRVGQKTLDDSTPGEWMKIALKKEDLLVE